MHILITNPDFHAYAVMLLVCLALLLFASERVPLATSSLLIMVTLLLLFEIFPYTGSNGLFQASDLFLGFGHQALIAVCSLMIAGQALVRTGALEPVGRHLARRWAKHPKLTFLFTLVLAALLSAFVNNTPVVILLLPILISVSLKTGEGLATLFSHVLQAEFKRNWLTKLAALCALPVLNAVRRRLDHRRYNGASLLGLNGIVIKSHGSADVSAYLNAIRIASIEIEKDVPQRISSVIESHFRGAQETVT